MKVELPGHTDKVDKFFNYPMSSIKADMGFSIIGQ